MLIPDRVGSRVFGASWAGANDVLLIVGLAYVANAMTTGAVSGLRAMGWTGLSLRLRVIAAGFIVVFTLLGTSRSAPEGALAGFAAGSYAAAVTWWVGFRWRYRHHASVAVFGFESRGSR